MIIGTGVLYSEWLLVFYILRGNRPVGARRPADCVVKLELIDDRDCFMMEQDRHPLGGPPPGSPPRQGHGFTRETGTDEKAPERSGAFSLGGEGRRGYMLA